MFISKIVRAAAVMVLAALLLPAAAARAEERNACGCYQTDSGACVCDKKARCGCPGLCEPQGCEAQREKVFQRELDEETRKVRDADRQRAGVKEEATPRAAAPLPARPAPATPAMTPVQQKELIKLLDLYFAAHPDARGESAGTLRDQIRPSTAGRR